MDDGPGHNPGVEVPVQDATVWHRPDLPPTEQAPQSEAQHSTSAPPGQNPASYKPAQGRDVFWHWPAPPSLV